MKNYTPEFKRRLRAALARVAGHDCGEPMPEFFLGNVKIQTGNYVFENYPQQPVYLNNGEGMLLFCIHGLN